MRFWGDEMLKDSVSLILNLVLKHIDEGIHIVDSEGNTVYYNEAMAHLEGLEKKQVLNKKMLDVFPSLSRETSTLMRVLKTGEPIFNQRQNYTNIKGQHISTVNTTIPIIEKGEIIGALEIAKNVTEVKKLSEKIVDLQQEIIEKKSKRSGNISAKYTFLDIVGESRQLKNAITVARKAARTTSSVLVYGETGTGKELFVQSIHNEGPRRFKPFVAQNCAALPESLLEGILFGTVKGGFTGAVDRPGLFEQADGGTLFLDEINSMGLGLQAKLLRVLQEGCIRRVGGTKEIPVDVRIMATTNINPWDAVEKGFLRRDLYYRLNVVSINIPPLRERKEDIMPLTCHFIDKYSKHLGKKVEGITKEVKQIFFNYNWPGNVRELQNTIEGAMNLITDENLIDTKHLPSYLIEQTQKNELQQFDDINVNLKDGISLKHTLESLERQIIKKTLEKTEHNISQAARRLNVTRQALQYKIKKYGFNK